MLVSAKTVDIWTKCNNIKTILKTNEKQINFAGSPPLRNRIYLMFIIFTFILTTNVFSHVIAW